MLNRNSTGTRYTNCGHHLGRVEQRPQDALDDVGAAAQHAERHGDRDADHVMTSTWLSVSIAWSHTSAATAMPTMHDTADARPGASRALTHPIGGDDADHDVPGSARSNSRTGSSTLVTRKSLIDCVPPITGTPLRKLSLTQSTMSLTAA